MHRKQIHAVSISCQPPHLLAPLPRPPSLLEMLYSCHIMIPRSLSQRREGCWWSKRTETDRFDATYLCYNRGYTEENGGRPRDNESKTEMGQVVKTKLSGP